jgi:hypothetical protein
MTWKAAKRGGQWTLLATSLELRKRSPCNAYWNAYEGVRDHDNAESDSILTRGVAFPAPIRAATIARSTSTANLRTQPAR